MVLFLIFLGVIFLSWDLERELRNFIGFIGRTVSDTKECSSMGSCCHCKNSLTAEWLATMVAWFTVVVEANCIRQPVFLFVVVVPHSGIRKKGGTTRKLPLLLFYTIILWYQHKPCNQGNHSVVKTTIFLLVAHDDTQVYISIECSNINLYYLL